MNRNALPEKADVVVVGGGIIGASTLYHLAKAGVDHAVLVERKKLGSGTTWHAAGIVGQLRGSKTETDLAIYTTNLFKSLEEETGQGTGYKQNGSINVILDPVTLEIHQRRVSHAKRMGVEASMLTMEELAGYWPLLNLDGVIGASYVPSNGQVSALDVTQALAKGAQQRGAAVFEETLVTQVLVKNGRVYGVETNRGVIATENVVLACGMWTHQLAKQHGVAVPLHAAEHFYIVTDRIPDLSPQIPILAISAERSYWKEETGKLLIGGFEASAKAWPKEAIPNDFEFGEIPFDMPHVEPLLDKVFARVPALQTMGIQLLFCGPESFTPDGRHYMGPSSEVDGLYIAAGFNSEGILSSGGAGYIMASWVKDKLPEKGMSGLHIQRAHPFQSNKRYLEERVTESLGLHMTLHWPGHHVHTARGVRRVPLHDRLAAAGAVFGQRIGWEMPMYFDKPGATWPTKPSLGYQEWFPLVEAECHAVQNAVGLCDQSMYGKILVQGKGAVRLLNKICGANVDVAVGTSVYSQFLNQRGGIVADVTVNRMANGRFMVLTGHPTQIRDETYIRKNIGEGWQVEVFDATSAYSLLSLHGPNARALLASLSRDDLSNDAFPFGQLREIDLAYARVWAIRRSFYGELGYELMIPTEFTASVYEALLAKGSAFGLKHIGIFSMLHCRMEKAFRHFPHDIAEEDTPLETGLGFAIDWDKPDFLGRDVLLAQREQAPATQNRTVVVALKEATQKEGPFLLHNEPIWLGDEIVGFVTSGAWGFRVGCSLGIASLHRDEGVTRRWIEANEFEVEIALKRYPIDVQLRPFYDPKGFLMRG